MGPNLFIIPGFIVVPITLLFFLAIRSKSETTLGIILAIISFDQLGFTFSGSFFDPVKLLSLITLVLIFLGIIQKLKINFFLFLFIAYFIFRDLISFFFLDNLSISALKYSAQFYIYFIGILCFTAFISTACKELNKPIIVLVMIKTILLVSSIIVFYQILAFYTGFPINGIKNAHVVGTTEGTKWAAFTMLGVNVIRPWGLYGEPKFLASVAAVSFAVLGYPSVTDLISRTLSTFLSFLCILLILVTFSTSGFLSLIAVLFGRIILSVGSAKKIISLLAFCLVLALTINYLSTFDLIRDIFSVRITDRLQSTDEAFQGAESYYLKEVLANGALIIFGKGYSFFNEVMGYTGVRSVPNFGLLWYLVSVGCLGIGIIVMGLLGGAKVDPMLLPITFPLFIYQANATFFVILIVCILLHHQQAEQFN
jgi:hypothetical protein